jgi:hypothetical protein
VLCGSRQKNYLFMGPEGGRKSAAIAETGGGKVFHGSARIRVGDSPTKAINNVEPDNNIQGNRRRQRLERRIGRINIQAGVVQRHARDQTRYVRNAQHCAGIHVRRASQKVHAERGSILGGSSRQRYRDGRRIVRAGNRDRRRVGDSPAKAIFNVEPDNNIQRRAGRQRLERRIGSINIQARAVQRYARDQTRYVRDAQHRVGINGRGSFNKINGI